MQVVSICTRATERKWVAAMETYGLKTVSLHANEAWQKRLEERYGINVYPHHVLIDADGRIIENYATRPSDGVAEKIHKALKITGR